MNRIHRSLFTAALALALTGGLAVSAVAQQGPPLDGPHHHQPNPEQQVKHLARRLNLTPDQQARLEPVFASRDQQIEAIRSNGQLTQQAAREQMHAIQKSTQEQLATILTPEQLQEMKQMRRGPHGPGGPHGQWQPGQGQPPAPPNGL